MTKFESMVKVLEAKKTNNNQYALIDAISTLEDVAKARELIRWDCLIPGIDEIENWILRMSDKNISESEMYDIACDIPYKCEMKSQAIHRLLEVRIACDYFEEGEMIYEYDKDENLFYESEYDILKVVSISNEKVILMDSDGDEQERSIGNIDLVNEETRERLRFPIKVSDIISKRSQQ